MAAFPDTVSPITPYAIGDAFRTLVAGPYDNGRKVRQAARAFSLYRARPRFPKQYFSRYEEHYQFFMDRRGSFESFTWFDWNGAQLPVPGMQWPKLYVGERDGTTTVFDLPYKSGATGYLVYSNGSLLTVTTHYTIAAGTGTDGRDRLTLTAAGTAGHVLTASAYGRRAVNVTFTDDEMSFDAFHALITTWGLGVEEVRD